MEKQEKHQPLWYHQLSIYSGIPDHWYIGSDPGSMQLVHLPELSWQNRDKPQKEAKHENEVKHDE